MYDDIKMKGKKTTTVKIAIDQWKLHISSVCPGQSVKSDI
jgi:hypothetical protein